MDYRQTHVVAKRIASILAENEATVNDLTEIFKKVKDYLVVTVECVPPQRFAFGGIKIPDITDDGDEIGNE